MYKTMVFILLLGTVVFCQATQIEIVFEDDLGIRDPTPVTPVYGNPGKTLGELRTNQATFGRDLLERIFWVPDTQPLEMEVSFSPDDPAAGRAAAYGSPTLRSSYPNNLWIPTALIAARPDLYPPSEFPLGGELDPSYPLAQVMYLWFEPLPSLPTRLEEARLGEVYFDYSIPSQRDGRDDGTMLLYLHEVLHGLGHISWFVSCDDLGGFRTTYDLHIRWLDDLSVNPEDMTEEQCLSFADNAVWVGESTTEAAGRTLTAGQVNGSVLLRHQFDFSHLSITIRPFQILTGFRNESTLGIAAYMLSDMGYGPVIDSKVFIEDAKDNTLRVDVDSIVSPEFTDTVEHLRVNLHLPEGLAVDSATTTPAECDLTATPIVCDYSTFGGPSVLEFLLTGETGLYDIKADVDHRALHVDAAPLNNFDRVSFVMNRESWQVPLNTRLSFTTDDFPGQYVVSGLGRPGATLTWSTDNEVHFQFLLEEAESDILVDLRVYPFLRDELVSEQTVSVMVNGEEIAQWQLTEKGVFQRQLRIPAELIPAGELFTMTFHLPDAVIPADLGINHPDRRLLGLGFISMTFSAE